MGKVHVGAPPDIYNPAGQNWGLPPFNPRALEAEAYRSFIELIRANMRHAGALRIDHVMALQHLYCVPAGCPPSQGAYLGYPLDDLVGILKLESVRQRCLIVGEDLGTVPEGFRERMAAARILSYRVLFFEKDANGLRPPGDYPRLSVAVEGSHDLPTLRAWWSGSDLELKERLRLFPSPRDAQRASTERDQDREAFAASLRVQGIAGPVGNGERLFEAAHTYLARTASALALVQLDDITDECDPVNVPNTSTEHPNWRRKLSIELDAIRTSPRLQKVAELFESERHE
jgi:4-alpha-glucanotransferase